MCCVCGGPACHSTNVEGEVHAFLPASGLLRLNVIRLDSMWLNPLSHLISPFMVTLQ